MYCTDLFWTNVRFQSWDDPNRGLLHVWEIFAKLRLKRLYDADTIMRTTNYCSRWNLLEDILKKILNNKHIFPHSLTNELLPFMSPWNIVYISKLRRYCIRPGASGRISTSQWAFHNLARPRVVCVGTGHQGHVHIYIDQGYAVTPLPQLQIQLYLYPWDGWDWCLVPFFQDSKIDIQTYNQHEPRTQSK